VALTVTSRGTGNHNTGATTLTPGGRSATLAAGSMGVLCISADNAGANGSTLMGPASQADSKGNVWTLRQDALYDNGAASAGIEMLIYTAPITVAFLTTDTLTLTWVAGVSPVAKAWTWYEVIPSGANTVAYTTGGTIAGATAANAQVTTASFLVGDAVIAGYFSENVAAVTGDSDTTNGTWTAQQTDTIGTTTSGVRIATQQKVQTTSASTQSYDVTVTSQDRIAGYIMLHEVVNTTATIGVASLTTSAFAPTVTAPDNKLVTPGVASLATSTFVPTVTATANQVVTPSVASLTTAAFVPTVTASDHKLVTPAVASLSTSAFAPTVTASDHQLATPGVALLALSAFAPDVSTTAGVTAVPDTASLTTSAFAPTVTATDNKLAAPDVASLAISAFVPTVTATDLKVVTPGVAGLTLTAFAPTVTAPNPVTVTPGTAVLGLTGFAPGVAAGVRVTPEPAMLTMTTFAPTVTGSATVKPRVRVRNPLRLAYPRHMVPGTAHLSLTTYPPAVILFDRDLADLMGLLLT
jgi:hypothetical protein